MHILMFGTHYSDTFYFLFSGQLGMQRETHSPDPISAGCWRKKENEILILFYFFCSPKSIRKGGLQKEGKSYSFEE